MKWIRWSLATTKLGFLRAHGPQDDALKSDFSPRQFGIERVLTSFWRFLKAREVARRVDTALAWLGTESH